MRTAFACGHMLDAARDAVSFSAGRKRADLDRDRQLALAPVKCVEIVGEAACDLAAPRGVGTARHVSVDSPSAEP